MTKVSRGRSGKELKSQSKMSVPLSISEAMSCTTFSYFSFFFSHIRFIVLKSNSNHSISARSELEKCIGILEVIFLHSLFLSRSPYSCCISPLLPLFPLSLSIQVEKKTKKNMEETYNTNSFNVFMVAMTSIFLFFDAIYLIWKYRSVRRERQERKEYVSALILRLSWKA